MCTVCGCSTESVEDQTATVRHADDHHRAGADPHATAHGHAHQHVGHSQHGWYRQDHDHEPHDHGDGMRLTEGRLDAGSGLAGVHVAGLSQGRIVRIERDILAKNRAYAQANRARIANAGIFALNLVSSPGSGKTTLLCRVIDTMKDRFPIVVIEGDQQTSNDADRIRATGIKAIQINTGKGCHLDAHMVGHALESLPLEPGGLLFIENVGNLVCPAAFDLGEAHKVVILSVTEGEDKPLKYPEMFAAADLMLLNKSDLLPHLEFDVGACMANALRVNPRIQILPLSARTGAGLAAFVAWIEARATLRPAASVIATTAQRAGLGPPAA